MMTKRPAGNERFVYGFSLERRVPSDHLLRKIKSAIDFDFVYDLVGEHYSHTGAPSIDPVVVFKLSLIGYLYNIPSERRLLEDASLNLAYLWFLGYDIDEELPDHSIMTKARVRFGPDAYRRFFHRVVRACAEAGLVEGDTAFLDSTLIEAQGKLHDLRSRPLVEQARGLSEKFIEELFENEPQTPAKSGALGSRMPKRTNDRLLHRQDIDADIVKRKEGEAKLCYKGHMAVDGGKSRIVTSVVATGGAAADEHYLPALIAEHEQLIRRPSRVAADQKYGSAANFRLLKAKRIAPAIKVPQRGKKTKGFSKAKFHFDRANDVFICPNQKTLTKASSLPRYQPYRAAKADCKRCPLKPQCVTQGTRRTVVRTGNEQILSWAKEMLALPGAKELLRRRQVWPETIFAHAKMFHGMNQARFRGRWKVEIQLLMTAAAMNLEKLAKRAPRQVQENRLSPLSNRIPVLRPQNVF
jgi:transposase